MTTALVVIVILVLVALLAIGLYTGLQVVQQYERGIVFRFGRARARVREPGLCVLLPFGIERMRKMNMQIVTMPVPNQEGITKDNVTLSVDAVVYFRVVDPFKAVVNVQNYIFAVSQVAHTSLRSVIGHHDMDELLSEREQVNAHLREIIDEPTEAPWGVKIERVEVKDVALPEAMKRSMSRQAEAERERRARVIIADGEYQASTRLAQAGRALSADPSALQLRLLQTVVEVAAEKNSTVIVPFPVELLRFLDAQARVATQAAERVVPDEVSLPTQPSEAALPAGEAPERTTRRP
jgi:regulator of protease activity HflC (stomatin/prohibitin superfamily)